MKTLMSDRRLGTLLVGVVIGVASASVHADRERALQDIPVVAPANLGSLAEDLVYTPIAPCRIVDTRSAAAGQLAAGVSQNFYAINPPSNFALQGGSSTNCGTLSLQATAVAVNITVVSPAGQGYLTLHKYGTTRPTVATMVYAAGSLISNAAIVQIPNPTTSSDITAFSSNNTHLVMDIVGYFAPPKATAVSCINTSSVSASVAANSGGSVTGPACTAGYMLVNTLCGSISWEGRLVSTSDGVCYYYNPTGASITVTAVNKCCQVPGR